MKAVVQRVSSASVKISDEVFSEIGGGLLIFLGVAKGDGYRDVDYLVKKTAGLRIFKDFNKNMNLSLQDIGGEALVVSQFTLYADTHRGRRPSFVSAEKPKIAKNMYDRYCQNLHLMDIPVSKGKFGALMDVQLVNDGPVTIIIDSHVVCK